MADIIDDANATAEVFLEAALKNRARSVLKYNTHGIGMCLNCGADVEGDRRWCDADCRDDWQKEQGRRG